MTRKLLVVKAMDQAQAQLAHSLLLQHCPCLFNVYIDRDQYYKFNSPREHWELKGSEITVMDIDMFPLLGRRAFILNGIIFYSIVYTVGAQAGPVNHSQYSATSQLANHSVYQLFLIVSITIHRHGGPCRTRQPGQSRRAAAQHEQDPTVPDRRTIIANWHSFIYYASIKGFVLGRELHRWVFAWA